VANSRNEISAGGVVYRERDGEIEVLICKAASYHQWVLPKGLVDKGESFEQAALREVTEEVGVTARIVSEIGEPERYIYSRNGMRIFKEVHYFLMEYVSGSEADHDHEMEAVEWLPIQQAINTLAYDGAKNVLRKAVDLLKPSA
jgi:8-oxo-dGTP pyrophosphatase MutT (NUDIX family)